MDEAEQPNPRGKARATPYVFAAVAAVAVLGALAFLFVAPVLRQDVVVLGRVEWVDVCDGSVDIDAVGSRYEAHYCMRFHVRRVLKGSFGKEKLGRILHSPSMTFWGHGDVGSDVLLGLEDDRGEGKGRYLWLREQCWIPP